VPGLLLALHAGHGGGGKSAGGSRAAPFHYS